MKKGLGTETTLFQAEQFRLKSCLVCLWRKILYLHQEASMSQFGSDFDSRNNKSVKEAIAIILSYDHLIFQL